MRINIVYSLLIISIQIGLSQQNTDYCKEYEQTLDLFEEYSYVGLSAENFNGQYFIADFIYTLDPNHILFNPDDIYKYQELIPFLKPTSKNLYCNTEKKLIGPYISALKNSLNILKGIDSSEVDFNSEDKYVLCEKLDTLRYQVGQKKRIEQYIKYEALKNTFPDKETYDSLIKNPTILKKELIKNAGIAISEEKDIIKKLLENDNLIRPALFNAFINTFLAQFDPHSMYFSQEVYANFKDGLSSFSSSFGIELEINSKNEFIVSSLVPGSYAWRTGNINIGDKIIEVQYKNNPPLKLEHAGFDRINNYLSGVEEDGLHLKINTKNNHEKEVVIYRELLVNEENKVQCKVLSGDKKIGYIMLPAFYTSWESNNAFGCAQDVAKAIYSLKKENVGSIILDLRNNSGGSIKEAIELAGIFIDFGTLLIEQNKANELFSVKDFNRGVMYSGPLAVLVNRHSASASEIVAAILQDYNRAIIVGQQTFGKASGQLLLPIGANLNYLKESDFKEKNTLKVTTTKYYRVTGNTYQKQGVKPDIYLPNINSSFSVAESDYKSALPNNTVNKKTYFNPLAPMPLTSLNSLSENRVKNNMKFQQISKIDTDLEMLFAALKEIPLKPDGFANIIYKKEGLFEKLEAISDSTTSTYRVESVAGEKNMINLYVHYSRLHEQLSEQILGDPYIEETYNILINYINLKNNQ